MRVSRGDVRGALLAVLCASVLLAAAAPVHGAAPEPIRVVTPSAAKTPPEPEYVGPCGLVVDPLGRFYVGNYYQNNVPLEDRYLLLANVDPLDGPCGLALDGAGHLYVNNYHRNVERYSLSTFPPPLAPPFPAPQFGPGVTIDSSHPTGVAVDSVTDHVYVNARTHLNAYDSTGAPLMDGSDPLKIGGGSLGDGYGLAVSAFPATLGRIYVPDHDDDTVVVYDPLIDKDDPVQTIAGPPGGFGSLRDSAVAVDRVSGEVYVADTRAYPQYSERPEATIRVFAADGTYKGRLKYNVIDGSPVGLAVDNTATASQGRVYVTSGNTYASSVYVYPPGSATTEMAPPLTATSKIAGLAGDGPRPAGDERAPEGAPAPGATASLTTQKGTLRVRVEGSLAPQHLPREGVAPISVSVGGEITTTDESLPPQLKSLRVELNRGGRLSTAGLPACSYDRIQPGSSRRALSACRASLVGGGSFTADITLAGQATYPTVGKLLLFHSVEKGRPVLYGHIYSAKPFASSFVIVFAVRRLARGTFGTVLDAPLPEAMEAWGRLTGLEMTLQRRYSHAGEARSFLSAGCPAPKGFSAAVFPLARTEFAFAGGRRMRATLTSQCRVRG